MRQPTTEDVMAACEAVRVLHDIMDGYSPEVTPEVFADARRATRVIRRWLDRFDEEEDG